MFQDVEKELENSLPEIVNFWVQEYQSPTPTVIPAIPADSVNSALIRLLSGTRKCAEKKDDRVAVTDVLAEEIAFFHDLSVSVREEGHALDSTFHCLATMRSTLEHFIEKCTAKNKHKLSAIQAMHRVVDCIETVILTEHRAANRLKLLERRFFARTRALEKSEKLLDSFFQSTEIGILLLDQKLNVIQANPAVCELYGIAEEAITGSSCHALTDEQGLHALSSACERIIEGEVHNLEYTSLSTDRRTFPSLVTVTSIYLDTQPLWLVTVRDIARQKVLETKVVEQAQHVEKMNVTLRNILQSIEKEKQEFQENLMTRIRSSLQPTITRIGREACEENRAQHLSHLQEQLLSLTTNAATVLDGDLLKLSKTELRVCRFIKAGLTGKQICHEMNVTFETIQTHRKNIRKKLQLQGRGVNLQTYLANRPL